MHSDVKISQWHVIANDKWLFSCLTWVPILLALSIWWIFSQNTARELPIGVIDLEHSKLSRLLIRELTATPTLDVVDTQLDISRAKTQLVENKIYAYVVIPRNFD